jgi:hypothetical protein
MSAGHPSSASVQQTPSPSLNQEASLDQPEGRRPPSAGSRPGLRRSLILDVVLPWVTVQILERNGIPVIPALTIAAAFPLLSIVVSWIRDRRTDIFGIAVLVTIVSGIAVSIATKDPHFAVVKAAPAFALFGLACLLSLPASRPLMFFVSRSFVARGDPVEIASWNARIATPRFRRSMQSITAVWGIAALAEATLGITLAFRLPSETALIVEPLLAIGTVFALIAWTQAFARARRLAASDPQA